MPSRNQVPPIQIRTIRFAFYDEKCRSTIELFFLIVFCTQEANGFRKVWRDYHIGISLKQRLGTNMLAPPSRSASLFTADENHYLLSQEARRGSFKGKRRQRARAVNGDLIAANTALNFGKRGPPVLP
jgi:hypothetical protein